MFTNLDIERGPHIVPLVDVDLHSKREFLRDVTPANRSVDCVLWIIYDKLLMLTPDETKPWFMTIRGYSSNNNKKLILFYGTSQLNRRKRGLLIQG